METKIYYYQSELYATELYEIQNRNGVLKAFKAVWTNFQDIGPVYVRVCMRIEGRPISENHLVFCYADKLMKKVPINFDDSEQIRLVRLERNLIEACAPLRNSFREGKECSLGFDICGYTLREEIKESGASKYTVTSVLSNQI